MEMDLDYVMKVVLQLSDKVGKIVDDRLTTIKTEIKTKTNKHDLVTNTDEEVETILMEGLSEKFPDHKFIAEEATSSGVKAQLTDDPTWIIDPVDGTLNFVHGYPSVCVSIGLTVNKEPVLGVINIPAMKMMFTAIKGKGAFLNGKQIHVSNTTALEDALLGIEFYRTSDFEQKIKRCIRYTDKLLAIVHSFRQTGSTCYNLAMLALGGIDVYFDIGVHAWDIAAGAIIIREAGGVVINVEGGPLDLMARNCVAAGTMELALETVKYVEIPETYPTRDDA